MRAITVFAITGLAAVSLGVAACGGSGQGVSTASVLDGAPKGGNTEVRGIKNDDPNARTIQVAWTAARAQRCGFVFDAAKLKANFLATEATRSGGQTPATTTEKIYDETFVTIATKTKADEAYCTPKKSDTIKADLQRHLTGNYDPNLPKEPAKVAEAGFWESLKSDEQTKAFNSKTFWADRAAQASGAKGAQE
jgi:hypothetical protein